MNEKEIIQTAQRLAGPPPSGGVIVAIGDDCAVYRTHGSKEDLVFTTDMMHEGRHFLMETHSAQDVGYKAIARGLSDLAAMGAEPRFSLLSIALTDKTDSSWVEQFYKGFLNLAMAHGAPLIGGDTAKAAAMSCDVIVCGGVPRGKALLRSGASPGDGIFVSGELGGSAAGLRMKSGAPWKRHLRPKPRLELGAHLRKAGLASACMDLSDGLSTDLHRLVAASQVSADLDGPLPVFAGATVEEALHGGEDYELLFTAPRKARVGEEFEGLRLTRIGTILKPGRTPVTWRGQPLAALGWDHFETRLEHS